MRYYFILIFLLGIGIFAQPNISQTEKIIAETHYSIGSEFAENGVHDSALIHLGIAKKKFYEAALWPRYISVLAKESYSLRSLGMPDSSLASAVDALKILQEFSITNDTLKSQVLDQIGYSYLYKSDFNKALEAAIEARTILGNYHANPIKTENYLLLGLIYEEMSSYDSALVYFRKSIMNSSEIFGNNHTTIGTAYNSIAHTYEIKGDYQKALEFYFKSLELKLALHGELHTDISILYNNIGANYFKQAENELAIEYYTKSVSIEEKLLQSDHPSLGYKYNNLAMAHRVYGDLDKAVFYAEKSLNIFEKAYGNKHPNYASVNNNIGRIYADKKEYEKALKYFFISYNIFQHKFGEDHPVTAKIQNNIGEMYSEQNEYSSAKEFMLKALEIRINSLGSHHEAVAGNLIDLAEIYFKQGELDSSLYYTHLALMSSSKNFKDEDFFVNPALEDCVNEAAVLKSLEQKGRIFNQRYTRTNNKNDLIAAVQTYTFASRLINQMRKSYKTEWSKLSLSRRYHSIFENGIRTAAELFKLTGKKLYKEIAFSLMEESKAGVLEDAITEADAKEYVGIPDSLLEKEKQLKIDLAFYDTQIQKIKNTHEVDTLKLKELENSFFALRRKLDEHIKILETGYPNYFRLKNQFDAISLYDVQQNVPNNSSAIVEYFTGDSTLAIFLVQSDSTILKTVSVKNLNEISLNFRESLFNINVDSFKSSAIKLYTMLVKPIENDLQKVKRLYIIPDGILNYIPFEALIGEGDESGGNNFPSMDYLINHYEISYHFSAASISPAGNRLQQCSFAGFAPVFPDKTNYFPLADVRKSSGENRSIKIEDKVYSSLPESEIEIKKIDELFTSRNLSSKKYLHSEALESNFKSEDIKNYSIIHIASHGLIDEENPKLSGILFSDSSMSEDGILYANEIYNLNLNADLAVLSACESGLGRIARGEGIIGLARGFIYSGVKNIIVSLWQVADKSTSELMIDFYKHILDGESYSSALRKAKLKLIKDENYSYPLEWSPFVLIKR